MPAFENTRIVAHSARAMFDLVADTERYPEFVPLCEGLRVIRRSTAPDGKEIQLAEMTIGYKLIRERFTSRVILDRAANRIHVQYVDGPFKHLDNRWHFRALGDTQCAVDFSIDYAFKSRTFEMLAGAVFDTLFRKMAAAFETRADTLFSAETKRG